MTIKCDTRSWVVSWISSQLIMPPLKCFLHLPPGTPLSLDFSPTSEVAPSLSFARPLNVWIAQGSDLRSVLSYLYSLTWTRHSFKYHVCADHSQTTSPLDPNSQPDYSTSPLAHQIISNVYDQDTTPISSLYTRSSLVSMVSGWKPRCYPWCFPSYSTTNPLGSPISSTCTAHDTLYHLSSFLPPPPCSIHFYFSFRLVH